MFETILNIYLIIENDDVVGFKAKAYELGGDDNGKIKYLKEHAKEDYSSAYNFDSPKDRKGKFMPYRKFAKLERQGMQYRLFEEIFQKFDVPENPLICVTPVVDGKILTS